MKKYLGKIMLAVYLAVCSAVMFMASASAAYIDPSSVSYGLMAASAIVIAGASVFVVWWRKAKRKVADKLGIDENANKEVEEDIEITLDEDSAVEPTAKEENVENEEKASDISADN